MTKSLKQLFKRGVSLLLTVLILASLVPTAMTPTASAVDATMGSIFTKAFLYLYDNYTKPTYVYEMCNDFNYGDATHSGYWTHIGYDQSLKGTETKNGLPDLEAFRQSGLCCASFVSYVYFNYFKNVLGYDVLK